MATGCSFADKVAFHHNYVGSVNLAGIAYRESDPTCVLIRDVGVYHSGVGL